MFEGLSERLEGIFRKWRGRGVLTEENLAEGLRDVRLALLEADVHFRVVKELIERVKARAVGREVLEHVTPGQQVVKIVWEELCRVLGSGGQGSGGLRLQSVSPTIAMLVGLQGAGKTTTAAKLADRLRREGHRVLLAAADTKRPAAAEQLGVLASQVGAEFRAPSPGEDPVSVCSEAVSRAKTSGHDVVILDTAGRLQIDESLMEELVRIREAVAPHERWLVADTMTGQQAVSVAERFHAQVDLTGLILTKAEGDARGGAILSMRAVTGCPIRFLGVGEDIEALEEFHPERVASRILGMGDILSLVERAEQTYSRERAEQLVRKARRADFDLEDFRGQIRQFRKLGSLEEILGMLPGLGKARRMLSESAPAIGSELGRVEAIINSMTPAERRRPEILNGSRRKRIALGSGTSVADVNRIYKQFLQAKKLMQRLGTAGPGAPREFFGG